MVNKFESSKKAKVKVKVNNKLSYWSSLASMVGKVGTLRQKVNGKCDWLKGEKPGGPGRDFQGCKVAIIITRFSY